MMQHIANSKIRNNKGGYQVTFPKSLAMHLDLVGGEEIEWTVREYDDGSIECTGILK